MNLEIRHLQQFVAVAEELHFSRAAERLRIAQPALSAQIRRLEEALGFALFERNTRRVWLTPRGEQFLSAVLPVLRNWEEALLVASSLRTSAAGRISLGISLRMHSGVRMDIQSTLSEIAPGVGLDFTAESSPRLVAAIAAGRIDAAVCLAPPRRDGLRYDKVRDDPLVAAVPAAHALAGRESAALIELEHDLWLMPDRGLGASSALREMSRAAGFEVRTADESTTNFDDEFLRVAAGSGIEVVSGSLVPRRAVEGVAFVAIEGHAVPLEVVHRGGATRPGLGAVLQAVREALGEPEPASV